MRRYVLTRRDGKAIDARDYLVRVRRDATDMLNYQAELKRNLGLDNGDAFIDIQHFYNAMTYAIHAFEDAFLSCLISLRK